MAVRRSSTAFALQPWAGLFGGVGGWVLHHQLISDALHFDCRSGNAVTTAIAGVVVILAIALAAGWSWSVLRKREGDKNTNALQDDEALSTHARQEQQRTADSRAFAARLSLMAAALFALLVGVQTMAGLLLPGCPP
jgi:Mg2+/citrate symporter